MARRKVDDETIFEDPSASALVIDIFNPHDNVYRENRDEPRFREVLGNIMALGYSEDAARDFLNAELAEYAEAS